MSGVLSEFAQHLEVERPHGSLTSTVDDIIKRQFRQGPA